MIYIWLTVLSLAIVFLFSVIQNLMDTMNNLKESNDSLLCMIEQLNKTKTRTPKKKVTKDSE